MRRGVAVSAEAQLQERRGSPPHPVPVPFLPSGQPKEEELSSPSFPYIEGELLYTQEDAGSPCTTAEQQPAPLLPTMKHPPWVVGSGRDQFRTCYHWGASLSHAPTSASMVVVLLLAILSWLASEITLGGGLTEFREVWTYTVLQSSTCMCLIKCLNALASFLLHWLLVHNK